MTPKRRYPHRSDRPRTRRRLSVERLQSRRVLATLLVTTASDIVDPDDGLISLREAIESSNALAGRDTIGFDPTVFLPDATTSTTITIQSGSLEIADSLEIVGPGEHRLTINGSGSSRVFDYTSLDGDLDISGITVAGGHTIARDAAGDQSGGAIRFRSQGRLTLSNTIWIDNATQGRDARGGAIYSERGSVVILDSALVGNHTSGAGAAGGAIHIASGTLLIADSWLSDNSTTGADARGGAIYSQGNQVSVIRTHLEENLTAGPRSDGGAIFASGGLTIETSRVERNRTDGLDADGGALFAIGSLAVLSSDVSGNTTSGDDASGGGLVAESAIVVIRSSSITSNQTQGNSSLGAGLFAARSDVSITQSTIAENRSNGQGSHGGGAALFASTATVASSTIATNTASGEGGGIFQFGTQSQSMTIQNTIVASNTSTLGSPDLNTPADLNLLSIESSLIGSNAGNALVQSQVPDALGNLIGGPTQPLLIDPKLGPLRHSGQSRFLPLLSDSPAIDQGNDQLLAGISTDQRGAPFARVFGASTDMGAIEMQTVAPNALIVNVANDEIDFTNADVSLREAVLVANGLAGNNEIQFDPNAFTAPTTLNLAGSEIVIADDVAILGLRNDIVTVDAGNLSRAFKVLDGVNNVQFTEIVIRGGQTVWPNQAGGGIQFLSAGQLNLNRVTLADNQTYGLTASGGAVSAPLGKVVLQHTRLVSNSTHGSESPGGGISAGGELQIVDSQIVENATFGSVSRGGGIAFDSQDRSFELLRSTVANNMTAGPQSNAGGIAIDAHQWSIINSTISGNQASGDGGGVIAFDVNQADVLGSTIVDNTAAGFVGGMEIQGTPSDLVTIENTVIAQNIDSGSAPDLQQAREGPELRFRFSLIGDNLGTLLSASPTPDADGNLVGSSQSPAGVIDPLLGPLVGAGGPALVHVPLPSSPLIDAGGVTLVATQTADFVSSDQRGFPFRRIDAGRADIGAIESQTLDPDDLIVTTDIDEFDFSNDALSLREALALADGSTGPDTIRFDAQQFAAPVTIQLALGELIIDHSVHLIGDPQTPITIDAMGRSRVFQIGRVNGASALPSNSSIDVLIEGIRITGGQTGLSSADPAMASGGAIAVNSGGTLTLRNVTLNDNRTTSPGAVGGAIVVSDAALHLQQSTFADNKTVGQNSHGGAVAVIGGSISVEQTSFQSNATEGEAADGGAIYARDAVVHVNASSISDNRVNGSMARGGGIALVNTEAVIRNTTVSGNISDAADSEAGGIFFDSPNRLSLVSSTVTQNVSQGVGGGLVIGDDATEVTIHNSIIAANSDSGSAPDVDIREPTTTIDLRASLVGDRTGTPFAEAQSADLFGNLIGSPLGVGIIDPRLGPLQLNGGSTRSHEPLPDSPVVNAGNDALAIDGDQNPLTSDQRALPFARFAGTIDIGAVESQLKQVPIINWPSPDPIFVGTPLTVRQLNASTNTSGTFIYTPDIGTTLPIGDQQLLIVQFVPDDVVHYATTSATMSIDVIDRFDFGDAPLSFRTTRSDDGPRHLIGDLRLGDLVDAEVDGNAGGDADRDRGDDGVAQITELLTDPVHDTTAAFVVMAGGRGKLDAWLDLDRDGQFDHLSEHIGGTTSMPLSSGRNIVPIVIPAGTAAGSIHARFRISSTGGLLPTGAAMDGEVEDYVFSIKEANDLQTVDLVLPPGNVTLSNQQDVFVVNRRGIDILRANVNALGRYRILDSELSSVLEIDSQGGNPIPTRGLVYDGGASINTVRVTGPVSEFDLAFDPGTPTASFNSSGDSLGGISLRHVDVIDMSDSVATELSIDAVAARRMDPDGGGVIVVGSAGDTLRLTDASSWAMVDPVSIAGFTFRRVVVSGTFLQLDFPPPWQNLVEANDVNNDGAVTPLDALNIVNELSLNRFSDPFTSLLDDPADIVIWPNTYFDQNGDARVTALDALRVINQIARQMSAEAESPGTSNHIAWASNSAPGSASRRLDDDAVDKIFAGQWTGRLF